jgi:hypothetical protein
MSISPSHIETYPDMAMPIDMSSTTEGVWAETVLGKRRRERYVIYRNRSAGPDDDDSSSRESPQKRGNSTTDGVLEAAWSAKRARRTPATKTQPKINRKSKAVGCGAGRFASTTARGVYHRSSLGPSVPQGSMGAGTTVMDRGERRRKRSTMQAAALCQEISEDIHAIPKTLTAWQWLLLQTTQADVERGAVSVMKCRLCPTERFKTWACFSRHCRDREEHPAKVKCCERCGIYFRRQDSMKRHNDSATKVCCVTTPAEVTWRKHKAEQLLADFQAMVEYCLRTGRSLVLHSPRSPEQSSRVGRRRCSY